MTWRAVCLNARFWTSINNFLSLSAPDALHSTEYHHFWRLQESVVHVSASARPHLTKWEGENNLILGNFKIFTSDHTSVDTSVSSSIHLTSKAHLSILHVNVLLTGISELNKMPWIFFFLNVGQLLCSPGNKKQFRKLVVSQTTVLSFGYNHDMPRSLNGRCSVE